MFSTSMIVHTRAVLMHSSGDTESNTSRSKGFTLIVINVLLLNIVINVLLKNVINILLIK